MVHSRRPSRVGACFEGSKATVRQVAHGPEARRSLAPREAAEVHTAQACQCGFDRFSAQPRPRGRVRRRCGGGQEVGERARERHSGSFAECKSQDQSASSSRARGSLQAVHRKGQQEGPASLRGHRQSSCPESRARGGGCRSGTSVGTSPSRSSAARARCKFQGVGVADTDRCSCAERDAFRVNPDKDGKWSGQGPPSAENVPAMPTKLQDLEGWVSDRNCELRNSERSHWWPKSDVWSAKGQRSWGCWAETATCPLMGNPDPLSCRD